MANATQQKEMFFMICIYLSFLVEVLSLTHARRKKSLFLNLQSRATRQIPKRFQNRGSSKLLLLSERDTGSGINGVEEWRSISKEDAAVVVDTLPCL